MRDVFCRSLVEYGSQSDFIFITGDLGFMALEPLRQVLGDRFINAGIAEQNMISVAAGMAKVGLRPWVYSIAPFVYARPFEQIRNDVCLPGLPVVLVGNGGGYGYGVMGATHHAIEDYGALLTLQHMRAFVPAFDSDVSHIVPTLMAATYPAYLRLGRTEEPANYVTPLFSPWRHLIEGGGPTMVVVGPVVGSLISPFLTMEVAVRPDVWVVSELPVNEIPEQFLLSMKRSGWIFVLEEHVVSGGVGQMLAHRLLEIGESPKRFTHRCARGYVSGLYGSQMFHRRECGLDPESIIMEVAQQI